MISTTTVYGSSYNHRLSIPSPHSVLATVAKEEEEEDNDDENKKEKADAVSFRLQAFRKYNTIPGHGQIIHSSVSEKPLQKQSNKEIHTSKETIHILLQQSQFGRAIDFLLQIAEIPSVETYWRLLKSCRTKENIPKANLVHMHLASNGLDITRFLGESLIITFSQCAGLSEAISLFHRLPYRTALSWASIISMYIDLGMYIDALTLYSCMLEDDVEPNKYIFVSLIRACSNIPDLQWGQYLHAQAVKYSCISELFVTSCLIDMYVKCGSLVHAQNVFDQVSQHDAVSLNSMLHAYLKQEKPENVLHLFEQMRNRGMNLNERTLMFGIQACCLLSDQESSFLSHQDINTIYTARMLHSEAVCYGFDLDVFVGSTLVNFYGIHGYILEARYMFNALPDHDVVSITAMLSAYAEQGQGRKALELYENLQALGVSPDEQTFTITLQACCKLVEEEELISMPLDVGRLVHTNIAMKGYDSDIFVRDSLVNMYGKCGSNLDAHYVFSQCCTHTSVSWNALISGHVQDGDAEKALQAYRLMQEYDVNPNEQTFVTALQACSLLADEEEAVIIEGKPKKVMSEEICRALHADARRRGFDSNAFIGSSLVNLYGKCMKIGYAHHAFDQVSHHDVVSWTAMVMCYLNVGDGTKSLQLYKLMQEEGVRPNAQTLVAGIQACCKVAETEENVILKAQPINPISNELGQALHLDVRRKCFESDAFVCSALVDMYGKCGNIGEAEKAFNQIDSPDIVLWNTMLSTYEEQGNAEKALQMYSIMLDKDVVLDCTSLTCVLNAYRRFGNLEGCRETHFSILSMGYDHDLTLITTLIYTYGDCSSMPDAYEVFMRLLNADVSSWNALLSGYAKEGNYSECLRNFEKMVVGSGIEPNKTTFTTLLSVCNHVGLVEESMKFLQSMSRDYSLVPDIEHYTCVVDVLGRAGDFMKVEDILSRMSMQPDVTMTLRLLSACQKHGNVGLGELLFYHAVMLQPWQDAPYVIMSNIYANAGLHDFAHQMKRHKSEQP